MAWRAAFDESLRLVVVTASGALRSAEVAEMVTRARELSLERSAHILYDLGTVTGLEIGSGELYWMPRNLPALREAPAVTRVALVYAPEFGQMARFWENAFRNAGIPAQAFTARESAIQWLTDREAT